MRHPTLPRSLLLCAAVAAMSSPLQAQGPVQRNASTAPPGFHSRRLAIVELGPELAGVHDLGLRLSEVTVEPGASFAAHSHRGQPEIIYVIQGTLTEQRNEDAPKDHASGSVLVMTQQITHALSNRGNVPAVYISTSVKP